MEIKRNYIQKLREKSENSNSKVSAGFQQFGLELAKILNDDAHKSLYIKLAKTKNQTTLMSLAKDISERPGINNRGAYFMKMLSR